MQRKGIFVTFSGEKVCMFVPSADGGHPLYAKELLTAMVRTGGCQVELVSSEYLTEAFDSELYPVHRILPTIQPRTHFRSSAQWVVDRLTYYPRQQRIFLRWLANQPHITLVHLQEWAPWLASSLIADIRALGKRVFYTAHNIIPHRSPPGVPPEMMHRWLRRAYRQCDGLFVHTPRLAKQLADFLENRHPPIHVTPHGIWTMDLPANPPSIEERLTWKRLLFFGTIRRNKGLDQLLRAMEQLPGYTLTIAGDPEEPAYFREEVVPLVHRLREMGIGIDLHDRFIPDDEMAALFASHSALMLPYTPAFTAQSGVLFMAITHGIPVIASAVGGLREMLSEHPIGMMIDQATPGQIADGIRRLYAQGLEMDVAGHLLRARQAYSWQATATATIAGYAQSLRSPSKSHACTLPTTSAA